MHLEGLIEQASRRVSTAENGHQRAAKPMDGLLLLRRDSPSSFEASLYEPVLCLILQGRKQVPIGEQTETPRLPVRDGCVGRIGKAGGQKPMMNGRGESDRPVVPAKLPNKAEQKVEEVAEGRGLAKGNMSQQNAPRTQCRTSAPSALARVRQAARVPVHGYAGIGAAVRNEPM